MIDCATEMYRSYENLVPVTNKYLAHKEFLKEEEVYKNKVKFFCLFRFHLFGNMNRLKICMVY